MQTWTEKGRSNVKLMMAKMGVPHDQGAANFSEYPDAVYHRFQLAVHESVGFKLKLHCVAE